MANIPKPPAYLTPATKKWFKSIVTEYALEPHHLRLLVLAAESWDECQRAREAVRKLGQTYTDRFGSPKERPEVATARQARTTFGRLLREVGLDAASSPTQPNRIGGSRY
jgi:phage terminase small subunit